jgi:FkbM family methyltransferase
LKGPQLIRDIVREVLEPIRKNGVLDVSAALRKGRISSTRGENHLVHWLITNRNDEIQRQQLARGFYERQELDQLRADLGERRVVLDIGANIGNHTVYFAKYFDSKRIIAVEPYGPAIRHLLVNLSLNYSPCYDLGFLGKAVGARESRAAIVGPTQFNIGLTRVVPNSTGEVAVTTGDAIVGSDPIDLIKIDVEGMELEVLAGLRKLLSNQRPAIFIEVGFENRERFLKMMQEIRYEVVRESAAYERQSNFTVSPVDSSSE